jgi:hypothetical protein
MRGPARLDSLDVSGETLSARLALPGREHTIRFHVPGGIERSGYDPFLVAALPLAMRFADSLEVPDPVSARLLAKLPEAQRLLADWTPSLEPVVVEAEAGRAAGDGAGGVASFFTGGSDSLYTAIRNRDRIDALVYVHGYEVRVDSPDKRRLVSTRLNRFADRFEVPLIELESNLRTDLTEGRVDWGMAHGAALAGAAHALGRFGRVLIPGSQTPDASVPWGSHPRLDHLWSTERVVIEHEGEAARVDKILFVSDYQPALDVFRVCMSRDADYNCGRCPKCANAALNLALGDALRRCPTLPDRVPLGVLALTPIAPIAEGSVWRSLELARERRRPLYAAALRLRLMLGRGRPLALRRRIAARAQGLRARLRRGDR